MQYQKAAGLCFSLATLLAGSTSIAQDAQVVVYAMDTSKEDTPPPNTLVQLNGKTVREFDADYAITFDNLSEGSYTVTVFTAESGYLPRQSPDDPEAFNDGTSEYANPRIVDISSDGSSVNSFRFDPVIAAEARVRDGWTMEPVTNASIEFLIQGDTEVPLYNYPWYSSYAEPWTTDARGAFPSNTYLYVDYYDLRLKAEHYDAYVWDTVITNAAAGDVHNLGTLFLYPTDSNTNGIGDHWEKRYFSSGACDPETDADFDGMSNYAEYIAGTDPTNQLSRLQVSTWAESGQLELTWNALPDRTYCISGTTNLCTTNSWQQVGGPWEATSNQFNMSWSETNINLSWGNAYRVEVVPLWWDGENAVLINTNRTVYEYTGGSSTNITDLPPTPGS